MNFSNPLNIITLLFLVFGSVIMVFASFQTGKVFKASKTSKYNRKWLALLILVGTFTLAYFISTLLFLIGQSNLLIIAFGLILLLGAIFVYVTMQLNLSTLLEIYAASTELKKYSADLEKIIEQRSNTLKRRISQLRTAAEISQIISLTKNKQHQLDQVVNLVQERFNLYYAGVFLIDKYSQFASLKAGSGEAGKKMIMDKHRLAIEDKSMIGWSINHKQAKIALDTGDEAIRFNNPILPLTRSELALPIILGTKVMGAMTIQSTEPSAFDQDDVIALKNIADTLSISLENAYLFGELEQRLEEIQASNSQYLSRAWVSKEDPSSKLEFTYENPRELIGDQLMTIEVPLILRDRIIGQLAIDSNSEWNEEEKSFIEKIATQAALALENARLLEDSKDIATRERLVAEISNKVWTAPNTDAILKTAVREIGRVLRADEATIELEFSNPDGDPGLRGVK